MKRLEHWFARYCIVVRASSRYLSLLQVEDTAPPGMRWNVSHLSALLAHARFYLKSQHEKCGGARPDDERVTVLCTDRLGEGLQALSRQLCDRHWNDALNSATHQRVTGTGAVPWLHRTQAAGEGLHYNMTDDLRRALLKEYAQDSRLYHRFCLQK